MHAALVAALAGLGTGMSLLVVIGAQNAFVLRQGLSRTHVPVVVGICAVSDLLLISLGIGGVGTVIRQWPTALKVTAWAGAAFLVTYGFMAARRALRPGRLTVGIESGGSLRTAALTCLAMTWLNPHVYLDTVLLVGSVANSYGSAKWPFGVGAGAASVMWFAGLGFGARLLRGPFSRPLSWRVLDAVIAVMMITLGVTMAIRA